MVSLLQDMRNDIAVILSRFSNFKSKNLTVKF